MGQQAGVSELHYLLWHLDMVVTGTVVDRFFPIVESPPGVRRAEEEEDTGRRHGIRAGDGLRPGEAYKIWNSSSLPSEYVAVTRLVGDIGAVMGRHERRLAHRRLHDISNT